MSDVENEVKSSKEETIFQIQSFVAEGKFKQADELVKKSLAENYNDPQMLSLSALVAVAMQDWVQAIARLHVVIKIQGNDTPPLPHLLLIRSYRCSGQLVEAMKADPSQINPGQAKPDQAGAANQIKPSRTKSGQTRPDQAKLGRVKSSSTKPE